MRMLAAYGMPMALFVLPAWAELPNGDAAASGQSAASNQISESQDPQQDLHRNPLPEGAVVRLGKLSADESVPPEEATWHTRTIEEVCFSPDGKYLATYGLDMTIRLWNAATGEQLRVFTDATTPLAFSPDAKYLLYAHSFRLEQEFRVWDLAAEEIVGRLPSTGSAPVPDQIVFGEHGNLITTFNGRLDAYRIPSFEPAPITAQRHYNLFAFSPDGLLVAAPPMEASRELGDRTTAICVYAIANNELRQTVRLTGNENLRKVRVAFSPDKRILAGSDSSRVIHVWELATGQELATLVGHQRDIHELQFSPDGLLLVSAGLDGEVRLWDVHSGTQLAGSFKHEEEIRSLAFSPTGDRLATASSDKTVLVWDVSAEMLSPAEFPALTPERFEELWKTLASPDVKLAYLAESELAGHPDKAVGLLRVRIESILEPSQRERILELIANLDSDEYMVRERATDELLRFREVALEELKAALRDTKSPEVRHRVNRILSTPADTPRFSAEELGRAARIVDFLARDRSPAAMALLKTIGDNFPARVILDAAQRELRAAAQQPHPKSAGG